MYLDIRLQNNTLGAAHELLTHLKPTCRTSVPSAAGSTTLTVNNTTGFTNGQVLLIGNWGEPTAEIVKTHATTTPTTTVITLAAATINDHYDDTPVTVIDFNQVEFSHSDTDGGVKTVLATKNIMAVKLETVLKDLDEDEGYYYFRFTTS